MSLITELRAAEEALEASKRRLEELHANPKLKAVKEFESALRTLMAQYNMSLLDVNTIIDPAFKAPKTKAPGSTKARTLRRFTNPHTGEAVESYGGVNKVLAEWREQYGWETVKGWAEVVK